MNILDCAYAMARHEGYADARCLGVKDGLLVFHLVDFPSNTPPPVTGYPEFLVGTTADDLQFVRGPECLAYFDLFEPDQRSEDFLAFRDALRAKEREDEALHDEDDDDDDWSLSSIEDEEMSDDEGFLVSADRFLTGDYTNWHFDPDWIRWQAACAIERFAPLVRYCCLSESGAEIPKPDDGTTLEDRENAPEARRARTCSHLLSIVTKRLFENPRAYFNYGPYWPAVKAILLKEKRLTGRAIEPVIARIYQGEDDLETLIMAELFRSALLRRNPLGETSWCLSENHRHAWRLVDPDMDAGNTSARTLLGIDSHELYETPEEAAAFQSGWWRSANDVRLVGFWRGVPVWVFLEDGQIVRDEVAYGETPDTIRVAALDRAERMLRELDPVDYECWRKIRNLPER